MDDVRAVMDAAGSESAALFGYSEGGPCGVLFAATYPERVRGLVLYGTYAKRRDPDDAYPWAPTWDERVQVAREFEATWGSNVDLTHVAGSRRGRGCVVPPAWPGVPQPCRSARPHPYELPGRRSGRPADDPVPDPRHTSHRRSRRAPRGGPIYRETDPREPVCRASGDDHTLVADPCRSRRGGGVPHRSQAEAVDRACPRDDPLHGPRRLDRAGNDARRRGVEGSSPVTTRRFAPNSTVSAARRSTQRAIASSPSSTGRRARFGADSPYAMR